VKGFMRDVRELLDYLSRPDVGDVLVVERFHGRSVPSRFRKSMLLSRRIHDVRRRETELMGAMT
jgi:hypothetical protein